MGYSFERIKRIICLRLVEHFSFVKWQKKSSSCQNGGNKSEGCKLHFYW